MRNKLASLTGVAALLGCAVWLGTGTAAAGSPDLKPGSVPDPYVAAVQSAAGTCGLVNAPLLAAQIEQESDWNPNAVSSVGAQGIAQFKPDTWAVYGGDFDGDGDGSPFDPQDAIVAQGRFMCDLFGQIQNSGLSGDLDTFTLWAYNAGIEATVAAGGQAPTQEAADYANRILFELVPKFRP